MTPGCCLNTTQITTLALRASFPAVLYFYSVLFGPDFLDPLFPCHSSFAFGTVFVKDSVMLLPFRHTQDDCTALFFLGSYTADSVHNASNGGMSRVLVALSSGFVNLVWTKADGKVSGVRNLSGGSEGVRPIDEMTGYSVRGAGESSWILEVHLMIAGTRLVHVIVRAGRRCDFAYCHHIGDGTRTTVDGQDEV